MIENLTLAERLPLARRRAEITQRQLANRFGLPRRLIQEIEKGSCRWEVPQVVRDFAERQLAGGLRDYEQCLVARWRSGKEVRQVAEDIRKSRWWVSCMESGMERCDILLAYWGL